MPGKKDTSPESSEIEKQFYGIRCRSNALKCIFVHFGKKELVLQK